ncbi:MAG: 4-(cytidine 5'-diphospho)-2-C-methyl-D-erythritol kinase [Spirochaetaceae bacterium]|jgi:4-diphosphocytidyl-2-C-methyl-D-erythritol kinase|nr:4-(cytidine 5'-diphospho)-2-C-methyl-D-erythritol kinase [Spirochaetaceae bacterium]
MNNSITLKTPCKINALLKVGERREDGFHSIESVFIALPLYDTLTFTAHPAKSFSCSILMNSETIPAAFDAVSLPLEKNIVYRAAGLFSGKKALSFHLEVHIQKAIPAGAGLGGASSDGAAALAALNRLFPSPFSQYELMALGTELGSDVPFFIMALENALCDSCGGADIEGGPFCAYVSGRGEHILRIPCPVKTPFWTVLVHPGFFSSTARAYALLDEYRAAPRPANEEAALNHFLPVFLQRGNPEERDGYTKLTADLQTYSPAIMGLTGSGSVCYAIFTNRQSAETAASTLKNRWPWVWSDSHDASL